MKKYRFPFRSQLALGIIAVLMVVAIGSQDTWATYTSQAVSGKNVMRGGSIELSMSPDSSGDERSITLTAHSKRTYGTVVKNDGHSALGYRARFVVDGDMSLCGALHVTANLAGKVVYAGRLMNFEYASEDPLERHKTDTWQFSIGLPESIPEFDESATCNLRWRVEAWQDRFLALGMGWYDEVESAVFTLDIEPDQGLTPESEKSALPGTVPLVPTVSETIVLDELATPIPVLVPDPETTSPTVVGDEVPSETEVIK